MSIRILNENDYSDEYFSLLEQLTSVEKENIKREDFKDYVNSQNDNWRTFVYEKNGKILASITLFIERKIIHGLGKVGHIEDVVCDKNSRGQGLGKKIIDFATEYCLSQGCYKVILDCADHNIGFYQKCGYEQKGAEMAFYF